MAKGVSGVEGVRGDQSPFWCEVGVSGNVDGCPDSQINFKTRKDEVDDIICGKIEPR